MTQSHVLVIGGGYAGLMATARAHLAGGRVTLVDPKPTFVDRIQLHAASGGRRDPRRPWSQVLPPAVRRIQGTATRVAQDGAEILTPEGTRHVGADSVVVCVGSRLRRPFDGPEVVHLDGPAEAARLDEARRTGERLTVLGAGPTGLEVATMLAAGGAQVHLVGPATTPWSPRVQAYLRRVLHELGIRWTEARADAVGDGAVWVDGVAHPTDRVVPCVGFEPAPFARSAGLPTSAAGALRVGPDLRVQGTRHLFGAGDGVEILGAETLGTGCAVALPMGAAAGTAAARTLHGQEVRPFRYAWQVRQVALGPRHAFTQHLTPSGEPTRGGTGLLSRWGRVALLAAVPRLARWEAQLGRPLYGIPGARDVTQLHEATA